MILPTNVVGIHARHVVTQVITQPAVTQPAQTLTTVVTLGPSPTQTADDGGGHGTGGLTNVQFGAIIGCVAAVVVIAIAAGICLSSKKKPDVVHEYYSSSSSSGSGRRRRRRRHPRRPPPATEWVPGGPKFPTYKAIPIPNLRNPEVAHTKS
jgi:hypothetical protein